MCSFDNFLKNSIILFCSCCALKEILSKFANFIKPSEGLFVFLETTIAEIKKLAQLKDIVEAKPVAEPLCLLKAPPFSGKLA